MTQAIDPPIIQPGEYVVMKSYYSYEVRQVVRTTAQTVFFRRGSHEGRGRLSDAVFCGPQDAAVKLAKQLESSRDRRREEESQARTRWIERDQRFIAEARAALIQKD